MAEIRRDGGDAPPQRHIPRPSRPRARHIGSGKESIWSDPARMPCHHRWSASVCRITRTSMPWAKGYLMRLRPLGWLSGKTKRSILDKLAEPLEHPGGYKQAMDTNVGCLSRRALTPQRETTVHSRTGRSSRLGMTTRHDPLMTGSAQRSNPWNRPGPFEFSK